VLGVHSDSMAQGFDRGANHLGCNAPPTGVRDRDPTGRREQNGDAVGDPHRQQDSGTIRPHGIRFIQRVQRAGRFGHPDDFCAVYLSQEGDIRGRQPKLRRYPLPVLRQLGIGQTLAPSEGEPPNPRREPVDRVQALERVGAQQLQIPSRTRLIAVDSRGLPILPWQA